MTEKLFYQNPYLTEFEATVVSVEKGKKGYSVVLDKTAFYPEGGGQPADGGRLNETPVIDVRKEGDIIAHITERPIEAETVLGKIDWDHRFDYMQQHTGQHIISGALIAAGIATVSVHQGESYTTIETDATDISPSTIEQVESRANEIIGKNLPVKTVWVSEAEIGSYPLRRPPKFSGTLRIVQVGEFDCVACGGVHTERTGEVGLVKCIGTEKIRGHVRTIWKIGKRAYRDYAEKTIITASLIDAFSVQQPEIVARVEQLQENVAEVTRELHWTQSRLAEHIAEGLLAGAVDSAVPVVTHEFHGEDKAIFRGIVERLGEQDRVAACLVNHLDEQVQWSICVSGVDFNFTEHRDELLTPVDGKGGGRPPIWQGVGRNPTGAAEMLSTFRRLVKS